MTPESEFKKFLIVILLLIASFVLISSSNASKYAWMHGYDEGLVYRNEYEKTGTGTQNYVTDLNYDDVENTHLDLQNSFFCLTNSNQWEFKPLNSPSGNSAYICESLIYKNPSTKKVEIRTIFGTSLSGSKYIKATVRYCKSS